MSAFDNSRCINQNLTFTYADKYFADNHLGFTDAHKRTLGLIDSDGYYTNAALLLSDQCEHSIKCAIYSGMGKTNFKQRKEFTGSILRHMDEAYEFVSLSNNLNSTFDSLKRVDHPDYPTYAIREALLKAIADKGSVKRGDVELLLSCSKFPAITLLNKLAAENRISKIGAAKATRYILP